LKGLSDCEELVGAITGDDGGLVLGKITVSILFNNLS